MFLEAGGFWSSAHDLKAACGSLSPSFIADVLLSHTIAASKNLTSSVPRMGQFCVQFGWGRANTGGTIHLEDHKSFQTLVMTPHSIIFYLHV